MIYSKVNGCSKMKIVIVRMLIYDSYIWKFFVLCEGIFEKGEKFDFKNTLTTIRCLLKINGRNNFNVNLFFFPSFGGFSYLPCFTHLLGHNC